MSRLLSSAVPSFTQASYTPLLDSRNSQDLTQDEDDLDPDAILLQQQSSQPSRSRQQSHPRNRQRARSTTSSSMNNNNEQLLQHTLGGSDTDNEEEDDFDHHTDGYVNAASDPANDSQSTIVSVHDGDEGREDESSNPGSPLKKKGRPESFEFSEPGHDRNGNRLLDEESGLGRGGLSESGTAGTDDSSDQGLWVQASTTLVIAVSGLICAGWLLDEVQHWPVFINISELIILIPILLNLKGNLEMNLASRLSTASNMGLLDTPVTRNAFIKGNLALLQLQSLTVGSVAGLFAFALGMVVHPTTNNLEEIALMISSSMLCASVSSFVLGSFMCGLVLICRHFRVNPDNIACPLASSFGDLVTLLILSGIAVFLEDYIKTPLCLILLLVLLAMIPGWIYYVHSNKFVSEVVKEGWGPVFAAMVIASTAGLTLERYINQYPGMAMISPVLNGLTGNIGSIYASRISTALHANVKENYRLTEKTLFLVHIPIEVLFLGVIGILKLGDVQWSAGVVIGYTFVALTLVVIALALAKWITKVFWRWGYDPDNYALPILTSLIDVLGTALLVVGFWALGYGTTALAPVPGE